MNVLEPDAVKRFLASSNWSEGGKERVVEDLEREGDEARSRF